MSFEALLPSSSIVTSIAPGASNEISLGDLRGYAIARYRDELACTRGEPDADQVRKDRNKVNQYSSAFNLAERQVGWDAPAELALHAAMSIAEKQANNRKPRAELQRAFKHLRQLKNKSCQLKNTPRSRPRAGSFKGVLSCAIESQDLSIAEIARQCDIEARKLWRWAYDNKNEPQEEAKELVIRLEKCLGLEGRLWCLRTPLKPRICWPEDFDTCLKLRDLFGGHFAIGAIPRGGAQRIGTQKANADYVSHFFGYLLNEHRMPLERLSLAYTIVVPAIEKYLEFTRVNKPLLEGQTTDDDKTLSKHDVKSLLVFMDILDYMSQDPSFASKLTPIPGFWSSEQVAFIQSNWRFACLGALNELRRIYDTQIGQTTLRFDNEKPIMSALDSVEPLMILHDLRRAAMKAVDASKTRLERAERLRDLFIVAVMMLLCLFRPKTVCHLDWKLGEDGSLFRKKDLNGTLGWWVCARKEFFKNHDKPILQNGYLRMVQDIDGLYDYVEEYLFEARGVLLDGSVSDCLVVNTSSNPRYTPNSYGDHVRYVTKRLLTIDLAGKYPTIDHLTCTQARKLFATSLDKKYNDPHYVEVKNALMNEMPTVYRHKTSRDRSRATEEHVRATAGA